jgi:hypothetical protein
MLEAVAAKISGPKKQSGEEDHTAPLEKLNLQDFIVFLNLNPALRRVIQ